MKFVELNDIEFMSFVNSRPEKNFFQTTMMKERMEKEGTKVYLVGVKKDNQVVAASLIAETGHSFLGRKSYEAYKGFILDYHDKELLEFMTKSVKEFLASKRALRLFIDPYIVNVSRDADANIVEGVDNREVVNTLHHLGYKDNPHGAQVKWCYCLDIAGKTEDQLLKEMKSNTRYCINKTISKFQLEIRTLKKNELKEFKKITSDTCDRRDFADRTLEYYEDMYDAFKDQVTFKIVDLNCDKFIAFLEKDNKDLKEKLGKLSDADANKKKKEEISKTIDINTKKIKEVKELKKAKGNIIPLSAAMFVLYGDEIVYLFSGSYAEYMQFYGQYRIQWEIIKYAVEHKYRRYNFYGIKDIFDKNGDGYGIYEFKKGFGGYVEELVGSFELSLSPLNSLYHLLSNIKHIGRK